MGQVQHVQHVQHLPHVFDAGDAAVAHWVPRFLGSALVAWFPAYMDGNGEGEFLDLISDFSGNGHDLTGGGGTASGTKKTNQLNGRSCFRFTAADSTYAQGTYTLNQPCTRLLVLKQRGTPANNDTLCDGAGGSSGQIYDAGPGTITAHAGSAALGIARPAVGTVLKIKLFLSGASSSMTINGTTATGNPGANNPGGFTMGAYAGLIANSDVDVFEASDINRAMTAAEDAYYAAYLLRTYGV